MECYICGSSKLLLMTECYTCLNCSRCQNNPKYQFNDDVVREHGTIHELDSDIIKCCERLNVCEYIYVLDHMSYI